MNDDALAYVAIMRLQRAYADTMTRGAWDEVVELVTPDARFTFDIQAAKVFEVEGAAAFAQFGEQSNKQFAFYEYIPLNFVVTIGTDGTAHGHSYSLEVAEVRETGDWMEFYGLYQDQYALFEGTWRFASRWYRTFGRRRNGRLEAQLLEARQFQERHQ